MTNVIRRHNSKIQKPTATTPEKKCNCRKKDDCPLDGACLTNNLVYKAVVTATGHGSKEYIGMTEHKFKTRFNNHRCSFKLKKHSTKTALSKYIWELKGSNTNYTTKWSIVRRASSYSGASTSCNLCPAEKTC